jgi:predicted CoA-binding protein
MDLGPARELTTDEEIAALLSGVKRVAVLGIKTEAQATQPAFYVPRYLVQAGLEVVPVPVYYPDVNSILGRKVFRLVAAVPAPPVDLVDVFRRASDLRPHLLDLLRARPRCVWFQQGIRDDQVAAELVRAGIHVVQDRCLMVEHERFVQAAG